MGLGDEKNIDIHIRVIKSQLTAGMEQATNEIRSGVEGIKAQFAGIGSTIGNALKNPLIAIGALTVGGAFLKGAISGAHELGNELGKASEKTGMSVEELSRLKYTAHLADIEMGSLVSGMQKLSLGMANAATGTGTAKEGFDSLGISVKTADGHLRPVKEVIGDVADKFKTMESGPTKTALAMMIFGKAGAQLIPMLNQGREGMQAMGDEAERLGVTMTTDGAEKAAQYEHAMKKLQAVGAGVKQSIGLALMPAVTDLANAFSESAGKGGMLDTILKGLGFTVRAFGSVILGLKTGLEIVFEVGKFVFVQLGTFIGGIAAAISLAARGQFGAAAAAARETGRDMRASFSSTVDAIVAKARAGDAALNSLLGFGSKGAGIQGGGAGGDDGPVFKGSGSGSSKKELWKEQLADEIAGFRLEEQAAAGNAEKIVEIRQRQLAAIRKHYKESSKEVQGALRDLMKAEEDHRQQATRTAQQMIEERRDHALAMLAVDQQIIENQRALGQISALTAVELTRQTMEKAYQIRLQAAEAERDLLDQNTEAYRQADAKVRAIIDQQAVAVVASQGQQALAIKATWDGVFSSINQAFSTMVTGFIQGTQTLRQGLSNLWFGIVAQAAQMGLKMVTNWASMELAKTGLTAAGAAQRVAIEGWAAVRSVAITAASILKSIAMHAVHAIAAAWAAISAIPFVGPFLAPAVAAGTGLAILALGSRIASAKGGYDIPAGINPVTQLHAREMVLPAHLADAVRGMAEGQGGAAAGSGAGGNNTFNIYALDARSFSRYIKDNARSLVDPIKQLAREGHLGVPA